MTQQLNSQKLLFFISNQISSQYLFQFIEYSNQDDGREQASPSNSKSLLQPSPYSFFLIIVNLLKFPHYLGISQYFYQMLKKQKKSDWKQQQIDLLGQIYYQFDSKKWKKISQVFKQKGYNRSQIECREKWINFLDPSINKDEWTEEELRTLYEVHGKVGTRWCFIQKYMNRTQNKIKNRFYGTLRNFIRFIIQYFEKDNICYNHEISKLSPRFLNDLYQSAAQFEFLNNQVKTAIYEMKFKIDKDILKRRIQSASAQYYRLFQIVFLSFQNKTKKINHSSNSISSSSNQPHTPINEEAEPPRINSVTSIENGCLQPIFPTVQPQIGTAYTFITFPQSCFIPSSSFFWF